MTIIPKSLWVARVAAVLSVVGSGAALKESGPSEYRRLEIARLLLEHGIVDVSRLDSSPGSFSVSNSPRQRGEEARTSTIEQRRALAALLYDNSHWNAGWIVLAMTCGVVSSAILFRRAIFSPNDSNS
jgi:hypothetical protein